MSFRRRVLGSTTSRCVFRHQCCPPQQSLLNSETKHMFFYPTTPRARFHAHTAVINTHHPDGAASVLSICSESQMKAWLEQKRPGGEVHEQSDNQTCQDQTQLQPVASAGFNGKIYISALFSYTTCLTLRQDRCTFILIRLYILKHCPSSLRSSISLCADRGHITGDLCSVR